MKENTYAQELVGIALRQLQSSYLFKQPRINTIRKYRSMRLNSVERQLRVRYNAPFPIFSGMIDTLEADLDDSIILKYAENDPADWLAAKKANVALKMEMESERPGAQWDDKFRMARDEEIMTGRGFLGFHAKNTDGFETNLSVVPFEDMFFEPKGGSNLENHMYRGRDNVWRTKKGIENEAGGVFDSAQVRKLTAMSGMEYKSAPVWENYDFANRYLPLGLSAEPNNYVGEEMFNLVEWELKHKGRYWYLVFEPYTGTWLRCDPLKEVNSDGGSHWMSFASHPDLKNFASKGFADDLYPIAKMMTDMINEDIENTRRRNSNARAYDKDMFYDVAALDTAQMGRDRLVPVNTFGGVRRIGDGIYHFETPEISGTLDKMKYLEATAQKNFGVSDLQQGETPKNNQTNFITYNQVGSISKILSFKSKPIVSVGKQLGSRYFCALKDYLNEPMAIKMLGEDGYEWDEIRRKDLSIKKPFSISVSSQNYENELNAVNSKRKMDSLREISKPMSPNFAGNPKVYNEYILREGGWSEAEITALLDPNTEATKEVIAKTSEVIQTLMQGRVPPIYYGATSYFLQKVKDFVFTHQDDRKVKNNFEKFMAYLEQHVEIAQINAQNKATSDIDTMARASMAPSPGMPAETPSMPPAVPSEMPI